MKRLLILLFLASFCFGQYAFTTVEELEFDGIMGHYSDVVAMNDSIFAVLYTGGVDSDCVLKTYEVDSDFTNITMTDSISVHTTNSAWNQIRKIDDDKIIIIITIGITETVATYDYDANWDATIIDTWNFPDMDGHYNLVLGATSTDKATVVSGTASVGYVATIGWDDGTGDNIAQLDIAYPANQHEDPMAYALNDSIIIATYTGAFGDPQVQSFNVGVNFTDIRDISNFELNTFHYDTNIAPIDGTHALTWYSHSDRLKSFFETISFTAGSGANIGTVETYQTTPNVTPGLIIGRGYLTQYPGGGDYVWFDSYNTLLIGRSYAVDGSYVTTVNSDSTKFSTVVPYGSDNGFVRGDLLDATTGTYVLVYTEAATFDGWLQTITVSAGGGGWAHKISGVETPTVVNSASEFTKISGVE